jgi:glycosyltransferase involved in cell wall biosynthesis
MTVSRAKVAVCVPTLGRPDEVRRLLENLLEQRRGAELIVIVDASDEDLTAAVCEEMAARFAPGVLRHVRAPRGLTLQRHLGLELLREEGDIAYVCMLDDDVWLDPGFLEVCADFLDSAEGHAYGGVSGYDLKNWGQPFNGLERLYRWTRLYDGDLRPGRWLRCGKFIELSRLELPSGVFRSDFLPGGMVVWRLSSLEGLVPPLAFEGYAQSEDKHLSLRVGIRYSLGVLGAALARHEPAEGGGRWGPARKGFMRVRHAAIMLKDCDPEPTKRRYLRFLMFRAVDVPMRIALALINRHWKALPSVLGAAAGWLSCVVWPPRRTDQALAPAAKAALAPYSATATGKSPKDEVPR